MGQNSTNLSWSGAHSGSAPGTAAHPGTEADADSARGDETETCKSVTILGATGSIGKNTLDLIGRNPEHFKIKALTANRNVQDLIDLALKFNAQSAVIADQSLYGALKDGLSGSGITAAAGDDGLIEAAREPADCIMAAIIGAAGLRPTYAALAQGSRVALANKECLVSAGDVFMDEVARSGTDLVPVDSEHSAAFQAIENTNIDAVERVVLTASGGPFRTWSHERLATAKVGDALKHPNWSMGAKITIDSATLMNKGLEIIEAYHLFPLEKDQFGIIIHPQSIIHCLVEYNDGSVLAQMSAPDMRTPIAYSLSWPRRMKAPTERLDLISQGRLEFEAPDEDRFPAMRLAREAMQAGSAACTILNAANEVAVESFLRQQLNFTGIAEIVEKTLTEADRLGLLNNYKTLDQVLELDSSGRDLARTLL